MSGRVERRLSIDGFQFLRPAPDTVGADHNWAFKKPSETLAAGILLGVDHLMAPIEKGMRFQSVHCFGTACRESVY